MKYISIQEQLTKSMNKSEAVDYIAKKNAADIDYIAMMCDVELEEIKDDDEEE